MITNTRPVKLSQYQQEGESHGLLSFEVLYAKPLQEAEVLNNRQRSRKQVTHDIVCCNSIKVTVMDKSAPTSSTDIDSDEMNLEPLTESLRAPCVRADGWELLLYTCPRKGQSQELTWLF